MFLSLSWLKHTYKPSIVILILEVHIISFFNDVIEHANETLCLMWWTQVETLIDYFIYLLF
jgi:hypothetical protein